MKKLSHKLTIFMIAYNSSYNKIKRIISKVNPLIKVIIIENSNDIKTKIFLERKFRNTKVILCKKNHGVSKGFNIGLQNTKTKYALYLDLDIKFSSKIINKFIQIADHIRDFALLVPQHHNGEYPSNWKFRPVEEDIEKIRMKRVHGHFFFFNMEAVKKIGKFDEKIFFYYDETDYCQRAYQKGLKIYLLKNIKVNHLGAGSYNKKFKLNIEPLRHWHIMWGKYYFHKKHYGSIYAFLIVIPDFFESVLKFIFFLVSNNKKKRYIYQNKILGLYNSMIGKSSWKRPEN